MIARPPHSRYPLVLSLALALSLPLGSTADGEPTSQTWNQWRGPARDGSVGGSAWPETLEGLEPLWRIELGKGYSGPIVTDDRVYVSETVADTHEAVRALDRATGKELWKVHWEAQGSVPFFAAANGDWIRSTPSFDGTSLFVGGMEEVLVKLDGDTGETLWTVDFPGRFGTKVPDFGFASSPLVTDEHVYVQAANSIVKLDKATGETVWRSLANAGDIMMSGAFSSPILATIGERQQLIVQTRAELNGIDPENGEVLWNQPVPHFRGMNILTPVVHGDGILTSSYKNKTYYFSIGDGPDGLQSTELWNHKGQGYMSSPVVVGDHAFLHMGNGRLLCLDLETGAERWISQPMSKYSSLVTQGDKLLLMGEDGELRLLRANPEQFEQLDSAEVSDQSTWAHLAVSGNEILVRELEAITAYRWNPTGPRPLTGAR